MLPHTFLPPPSYAQVVEQFIVPSTEDGTVAYVELLSDDLRGPHQYFVSHAWGMPFSSMVEQVGSLGSGLLQLACMDGVLDSNQNAMGV